MQILLIRLKLASIKSLRHKSLLLRVKLECIDWFKSLLLRVKLACIDWFLLLVDWYIVNGNRLASAEVINEEVTRLGGGRQHGGSDGRPCSTVDVAFGRLYRQHWLGLVGTANISFKQRFTNTKTQICFHWVCLLALCRIHVWFCPLPLKKVTPLRLNPGPASEYCCTQIS